IFGETVNHKGGAKMSEGQNSSFLLGALLGSLAGASLALIFAPKSGQEFRGDLNRGTRQALDKAGELKDKGSMYTEKAIEKGAELKDKGSALTNQTFTSKQKLTKEVQKKPVNWHKIYRKNQRILLKKQLIKQKISLKMFQKVQNRLRKMRSEERRVGKEWRSRGAIDEHKNNSDVSESITELAHFDVCLWRITEQKRHH